MNVFLVGSSNLTKYDKEEIASYLKKFAPMNTIHLLCYRSVENEVLKYFIENDKYAKNLRLYTLQPYENTPELLKESILYLKTKGALYHSFESTEIQIKRTFYEATWQTMLKGIDLVVCFYNGDKPTALIPVDVAKGLNVDAMIYELPCYSEEKLKRKLEDKVKVV